MIKTQHFIVNEKLARAGFKFAYPAQQNECSTNCAIKSTGETIVQIVFQHVRDSYKLSTYI